MRRIDQSLLAEVDLDEVNQALDAWVWRIGKRWSALAMSAAGDLFLTDASGRVARLDTGSGQLEMVANSMSDFEAACGNADNVRDWFLRPVVEQLRASGHVLARKQCYGFTILPVFKEGSYAAHNRFMLDAIEHLRVTADLHRQIDEHGDGDRIRLSVVP